MTPWHLLLLFLLSNPFCRCQTLVTPWCSDMKGRYNTSTCFKMRVCLFPGPKGKAGCNWYCGCGEEGPSFILLYLKGVSKWLLCVLWYKMGPGISLAYKMLLPFHWDGSSIDLSGILWLSLVLLLMNPRFSDFDSWSKQAIFKRTAWLKNPFFESGKGTPQNWPFLSIPNPCRWLQMHVTDWFGICIISMDFHDSMASFVVVSFVQPFL